MATLPLSKRAMIDKTNTTIVIIVSVAAFLSVFSLVAVKTLASQISYQNRVLSEKRTAASRLKENLTNVDQLKTSYDGFTGSVTNVIGGNAKGSGPNDGDNAKIVLDALPSVYDFPGTVTSIEYIVSQHSSISGITGVDNEVQEAANKLSSEPAPVEIPFQLTAKGDYTKVKDTIADLQKSIRPIEVKKLDISSASDELTLSVDGSTYYQPGKSLTIKTKVVK